MWCLGHGFITILENKCRCIDVWAELADLNTQEGNNSAIPFNQIFWQIYTGCIFTRLVHVASILCG